MKKRWLISRKYSKEFAKEFPEFSSVVLQLLWDRNIRNQTEIDEFFNPDYEQDLHDPFLMKGMSKAVDRILRAIEKDEKIVVYGDYDVDGVTSSAIIINTLLEIKSIISSRKKHETKKFASVYIPDREREGYGLNKKAITEIKNKGTNLIITVDCGISNFDKVEFAKKLGMDLVITDHHYVPEKPPKAFAVVNPKQKSCDYPFKELSGAGVAFKLAQAIFEKIRKRSKVSAKIGFGFEKWLLDLVALGTVADCVDILGENRTLTKYGLLVINKTRRVGIKKLVSVSGLKTIENGSISKKKEIDTSAISFVIAPRLNAAGRMDHANTSYGLITTDSEDKASKLALKLENNNKNRQRVTEKTVNEIKFRMDKYKSIPKVIIESDSNWKLGIVGLVAGKLADEYSRPFLIFQRRKKYSLGSGRSINEFNLIKSIEKCKDILIEFGGHSQAAGLKVANEHFEEFKKRINSIADETLKEKHFIPSLKIDCKVKHEQINWKLFDEVGKFEPFGHGNKKPVFLAEKLEVHEIKTVGTNNSHLKICFKTAQLSPKEKKTTKYFNAIAFNMGKLVDEMPEKKPGLRWGDIVDVVFQLDVNEWNGNRELQMNILDLKLSSDL